MPSDRFTSKPKNRDFFFPKAGGGKKSGVHTVTKSGKAERQEFRESVGALSSQTGVSVRREQAVFMCFSPEGSEARLFSSFGGPERLGSVSWSLQWRKLPSSAAPGVASLPEPEAPPRVPAPRGVSLQEPAGGGAGRDAWVASVPALMDGRRCLRGGDSSGHRAHRAPCAPTAPGLPGNRGSRSAVRTGERRDLRPRVDCGLRQVRVAPGPRVLPPRHPGAAPAPPPSPPALGPPRAGPVAARHGRAAGGGGRLSAAEGPRGGLCLRARPSWP